MDFTKFYADEAIQEKVRQLVLENLHPSEEASEYLDALLSEKPKDPDEYAWEHAEANIPVYTSDLFDWLHANYSYHRCHFAAEEAIQNGAKDLDSLVRMTIRIYREGINRTVNEYVEQVIQESGF